MAAGQVDRATPPVMAVSGTARRPAPPRPQARPGFERQGWRAGVVTRCTANVIDLAVTLAVLAGIYLGSAAVLFLWDPRGFSFPAPSPAVAIGVGTAVAAVYFAVAWIASGRTYGDAVLGVRVVARNGHRIRPGVALLRAAACVLFPLGLLWVLLSEQNRSLQDILLRTAVVYDWGDALPPADASHAAARSPDADDVVIPAPRAAS